MDTELFFSSKSYSSFSVAKGFGLCPKNKKLSAPTLSILTIIPYQVLFTNPKAS